MQNLWNTDNYNIVGELMYWLSETDPRPAQEQLDSAYQFGGWQPFQGFTLGADDSLRYPGDPTIRPRATAKLRDEVIHLYPSAWVCIIQPDRSYSVARMD